MIGLTQGGATPGPGRWRPLQAAVLWAIPLALIGLWKSLFQAKGPYWLGSNLDPDYAYLLNGLSILHGHGPRHVDHPGTPVQILVALLIKGTHLVSGSGPVADDVIQRPEHYLLAANGLLLLAFAGALVIAGLAALRATGSLLAGVAMQLLPGLSPLVALHVLCVKPEPFLATLTTLLAALVLHTLDPDRAKGRVPEAAWFGVLVGLAVAAKITAAPLAVVPLVLLRGLRPRALFAGVALLTSALATLPAWPALRGFREFITGIATHSGQYGTGPPSVFDLQEYLHGLRLLVQENAGALPAAVALLGLAAVAALSWRARRGGVAQVAAARDALLAAVAVQLASYLLVARHAASHYVLPAVVMAGLTAALVIHAVGVLVPPGSWPRRIVLVAAGLLLAGAALRFGRGLEEAGASLRAQRDDQLKVVGTLAERFPGARVVHHYRSSSPAYALHFGDMYTDAKWSRQVHDHYPLHHYYNLWNNRLEVYVPQPAGSKAKPLDFAMLTSEVLCGTGGERPVVFQGSLLQVVPSTVQETRLLGALLELVYSAGQEGLYRPVACTPEWSEPERHSQP
jgi:hypothetical protein